MLDNILVYIVHPHVEAWNFRDRHREQILRRFPHLNVTITRKSKDFLEQLPKADAVLVWFFKKEWLQSSPNLKLISTPAAGRDWIEVEAFDKDMLTFGGFHGRMIAESVLGAIFYFCKAFKLSHDLQKKRLWDRTKVSKKLTSLYRAKVSILGFGRIGQEIGRSIKPFGCHITGVKRTVSPPPVYFEEEDKIVAWDNLSDVLKTTDHLILVLPGGEETNRVFTKEHFRQLPSHCFLYNVGRGNVYEERDLVQVLKNQRIAGAYLDVFAEEPLSRNSVLWHLDNVLIQPHLSAASPQYLDLFVEEWLEKVSHLVG